MKTKQESRDMKTEQHSHFTVKPKLHSNFTMKTEQHSHITVKTKQQSLYMKTTQQSAEVKKQHSAVTVPCMATDLSLK